MKFQHRGYNIEVMTEEKDGLWLAHVRIWPVIETRRGLRDKLTLDGYGIESEALDAGLAWAKERIELYGSGKLPNP
jgi:hypothetical protein